MTNSPLWFKGTDVWFGAQCVHFLHYPLSDEDKDAVQNILNRANAILAELDPYSDARSPFVPTPTKPVKHKGRANTKDRRIK